jgi:hypothetical protein
MQSAGQLVDIFTPEESVNILHILTKLPNSKNTGDFKAYTNGFQTKDFIYPAMDKLVIKKIETALGIKINLLHGMLLKEETPWGIHTDYVKGDDNPGLAILIPLNTEDSDTHTVVFNQQCLDRFDNFILTNKKLENNAKDLYNNLCSHETISRLEYVSLLAAYKWYSGSIIYWDRKLLHSSDNFLQNGIKQKSALVLFTTN